MCTPYIESQKWLPWQRPLEPRNRLCLHRIACLRKSTPRIKQRVDSYHTTKVVANETSYSKLRPKSGYRSYSPSKAKKWLPWQRSLGAGYRQYLHSVGRPLKYPSITNYLGAIIHTKPVNSIFSPKIGCHGSPKSGCHGNVPQHR